MTHGTRLPQRGSTTLLTSVVATPRRNRPLQVLLALASVELPAHRLTLGIAQSVGLIELHRAEPRLATLPAAGVASAIDGFGTGDSCLSYLSRLPVDVLKINKSFVDGLLTSEHHAALRKTIHDTSRSLDMKTIAEGVESAAQGDWLRGERCTFRPGLPVVAGS